ncbi:TrmH family RNA methyltransferase [Candidatus Neptunochlamydia vexilliferae]|uniref:tRNA/rRNA methyltransferase SpoU type domain-containing protein n=1 Tax=Candidatus Neptunichlamydia vexilliferae TaxID=1651774 RepID=A0ABS0AZM3_9BACT|nr:TrmH family RNA methyltransferase [Candidatus Neptunochlamydia vexilliferae]MBF5059582.1 hypothetical protein [Candidatus Neptunochlamydia vexilliferae]
MTFTKEKFFSLPYRKRHKHAGRHLRSLYEQKLPLDPHYRMMEEWLELPPLEENREAISDRFHLHMREAAISLQEHNTLDVKRLDILSNAPYLPIGIYLEELRSAFNIGSILRTVEAFRLGTVYFSENTPFIDNPKVEKTAMGVAHTVPTQRGDLSTLPGPLIALETVEGAPSIFDFEFPDSFSLLLGNEEYGLKAKTLEAADHIVQIPLVGSKNSLNVASAFAIAAAHFSVAKRDRTLL